MTKFAVNIQLDAMTEMLNILDYIEFELQNPIAAKKQYLDFNAAIKQLEWEAGIHHVYFVNKQGTVVRNVSVNNYMLLYIILAGRLVEIIHVMHRLQDVERHLH